MDHISQRAVLFLTLASLASPSTAAVLRVKADAPGPAHDGASWATACISPGDALAAAAPGDEVWVAAGEYRSAASLMLREGVSLYGGFAGTESAREERDPAANVCTLRPTDTEITVVLAPPGITTATILDGFTITGGRGVRRNDSDYGGGLLCDQSLPTISNNVFTVNRVGDAPNRAGFGGGIAVLGGSPVVENNRFSLNAAEIYATYQYGSDRGGGVDIACIGGAAVIRGNTCAPMGGTAGARLYFENSTATVRENHLEGQSYGIQVQPGAAPTIDGNTIRNSAFSAIRCLANGRITGNTLVNSGRMPYPEIPVGIVVTTASPVIEGNSVSGFGFAGIAVRGGAPVISGNTLAGNGSSVTTYSPAALVLDATAALVRGNMIAQNIGAGVSVIKSDAAMPDAMPTLTGNAIRNTAGPAVLGSAAVALVDNDITSNAAGGPAISVAVAYGVTGPVTVRGNRITENATLGALRILHSEGSVEVSDNEIRGHTRRMTAAAQVQGRYVVFERNRVSENGGPSSAVDIRVNAGSALTSRVRNNLIVRNISPAPSGNGSALGVQGRADVVGNTIADNELGSGAALYLTDPNVVANNIVAFNRVGIVIEPNDYRQPTVSHNLAYGNMLADYGIVPDPLGVNGNLSADPLFVDRTAGDYRLLTGSPAINAGDDSVVLSGERDVAGNPRVVGAHVDIGAFEYLPPDPALVGDALRALRIAAGLDAAAAGDASSLDVDASGGVDLLDAARLLRRAAGQP